MPSWVIALWSKRPTLIWGPLADVLHSLRKQVADTRAEIERMRRP